MKALLWLIIHEALIMNERRVKQGLADNPNYMAYVNDMENLVYIFRYCSEMKGVWHYFEQSSQGIQDPNLAMEEWIHCNVTYTNLDSHWPTTFITIVWWL